MRNFPENNDRATARGMALTEAWFKDDFFQQRFNRGTARFKLSSEDERFLHQIFRARYSGGKLYWSNRDVRRAAAEAIIDALLDDLEEDEWRERWFGTFAWNGGITSEREPEVDIVSLKGKVDKAMREYGLEGIGVVEVDVTTPIVGENGRLLLFHVHVYCWTKDGSKFNGRKAAEKLMGTRRFPNRLDAPSVEFKPVRLYDISVARIAGYVTKFQPGAKNRIERRNKPGSYFFRSTHSGFTPDSVVRLVEVMSHFDARDVVFSVGPSGRKLRDRWYSRLTAWARQRSRTTRRGASEHDVAARWWSIRADNGSRRMKPCRIITRVAQRNKI